jgi:hypothetical protein
VLARRDDDDISGYFEESQRRQRAKGPAILARNSCYSSPRPEASRSTGWGWRCMWLTALSVPLFLLVVGFRRLAPHSRVVRENHRGHHRRARHAVIQNRARDGRSLSARDRAYASGLQLGRFRGPRAHQAPSGIAAVAPEARKPRRFRGRVGDLSQSSSRCFPTLSDELVHQDEIDLALLPDLFETVDFSYPLSGTSGMRT